jgi:hypothetical protein
MTVLPPAPAEGITTSPTAPLPPPPLGLTTEPQGWPAVQNVVPAAPLELPPEPPELGAADVSVPEQPGKSAADASAPDANDNNKCEARFFANFASQV